MTIIPPDEKGFMVLSISLIPLADHNDTLTEV